MSEWITDRPPTDEDADSEKCVWTMCAGKVVPWGYEGIRDGWPWMRTNRPEPYVKPKLQRYIVVPGKRDDRFLELQECEAAFDSAVCMSDDVKHIEAIYAELLEASEAVVARWDSPLWKDQPHTGVFIDRLRAAIAKAKGEEA